VIRLVHYVHGQLPSPAKMYRLHVLLPLCDIYHWGAAASLPVGDTAQMTYKLFKSLAKE